MTDSQGFDLDVVRLKSWFVDQQLTEDSATAFTAELLAGGRSNVTYRVWQNTCEWVVRRPPFGHVMPSAHDMAREFRVLTGMHRGGFRVPEPYAYCSDTEVIGAPFVVMEFVSGAIYAHAAQTDDLSVAQTAALSHELITVLHDLHRVDATAVGLGDFGRPDGFLQRQVVRWQKQWELSQTRDFPLMSQFSQELSRRIHELPAQADTAIIHGDYRLDNTIVDPATLQIKAVVDWEMSTLGHPLMDLALLLVYWTEPSDQLRQKIPLTDGVTDVPGFYSRAQLVDSYAALSDRSLDDLDVCIALSCMKLAVILESIRKRTLAGQQVGGSAEQAEQMRVATDALVEIGHLSLRDSGMTALGS